MPKPGARMPERIGKYVVIREVGRGSTGIVYLSHDAYYGRDVAIKVYNMDAGGDEERARIARKMFLSEAHLVGMLQHPHILPIYDAGVHVVDLDGDVAAVIGVVREVDDAGAAASYFPDDDVLTDPLRHAATGLGHRYGLGGR